MFITIWGLVAGGVIFFTTLILLAVVMSKGGKEDMGCEYRADHFVSYVRRNGIYTANIHERGKGNKLVSTLKNSSFLDLQKEVAVATKKKRG